MTLNAKKLAKPNILRCPICEQIVAYEAGKPLPAGFPFCSPRCKMRDLNAWLNEDYVLGRDLTTEEKEDLDPEELSREDLLALVRELQESKQNDEEDDDDIII
ncbi:MAG: DNA gyrase inhibitor YacG [Candidatus Poribacteria bacterium]|nr:DNA gyrase inhibitor YacG [Candidatus Poribacteria bacterium]